MIIKITVVITDLYVHRFEGLIDPVPEGVGLDLDPQVLVALDRHALGRGALGAPCSQPCLGDAPGGALGAVRTHTLVGHAWAFHLQLGKYLGELVFSLVLFPVFSVFSSFKHAENAEIKFKMRFEHKQGISERRSYNLINPNASRMLPR